jgi:hypothetical protein
MVKFHTAQKSKRKKRRRKKKDKAMQRSEPQVPSPRIRGKSAQG